MLIVSREGQVKHALTFALCVGLGWAGCVTASVAQQQADTMRRAVSQPFRDLGFVRDTPTAILQRASDAPYAIPAGGCPGLVSEIIALDFALGPDVDADHPDDEHRFRAGSLVTGAIRSAVSLPYRGIVRRISGAEHREHVMQDAQRSGMARRAFLKGLRMRDCASSEIASAPEQEMMDAPTPVRMMASSTPPAAPAVVAHAEPAPPAERPVVMASAAPAISGGTLTLAATEPQAVH